MVKNQEVICANILSFLQSESVNDVCKLLQRLPGLCPYRPHCPCRLSEL